jgi:hypothetical protein
MKALNSWKKVLAIGLIGGSFLFQNTAACTERAQVFTAVNSFVTMGGILYIVDRVMRD